MFANTLPESMIKGLSIRARELGAVNLGQGIPSFPTAPHILEAARVALSDPSIGVYPNFLGEIELRKAVAARLQHDHPGQSITVDSILITVGAMEATAAAIFSILSPEDSVGIISPDYCNHEPQVRLAKGVVRYIPFTESPDGWTLDRDAITEAFETGIKMLIYTNPSNPTGAVLTRDELTFIVATAKKHDAWVLSDETYNFLTYDVPFVSLLDVGDGYDKLITVRSFSKEYAMTGWRVGFLVAHPQYIGQLAKVHDALTGCAPKISQRAALAAIMGPQDIVETYRKTLAVRRTFALSALNSIPGITVVAPRGAYYLFPRYERDITSARLTEVLLTEYGVAVVPGDAFGGGGANHFRISFAPEDAVLTDGISRIAAYFSKNI